MPHSNMERKNKMKAVAFVSLVAISAALYWFVNREEKSEVDRTIFRLADYQSINRISFESKDEKVELSYNGSRWKVNDKYNADRNLIQVLFATLQQAEPRRPVAGAQRDSLTAQLAAHGIIVKLFNGEHLEQEFIAGGNDQKTRAYFQDTRTGDMFVMHIPGYRVYVSGIMELSESQWRDKLLFAFNWENFAGLAAEFPDKPQENFKVTMGKNYFEVDGLAKTDTAKLNTFLDNVSLLTANEILGDGKMADSLRALRPFMIIRAFDTAKKEFVLSVFRESGTVVAGLVQNRDAVLFNRLKVQPIIRPRSFFQAH